MLTFPSTLYELVRLLAGGSVVLPGFVYELFIYFLYINSSVNFYLYIAVNRHFRREFKTMARKYFFKGGASVGPEVSSRWTGAGPESSL